MNDKLRTNFLMIIGLACALAAQAAPSLMQVWLSVAAVIASACVINYVARARTQPSEEARADASASLFDTISLENEDLDPTAWVKDLSARRGRLDPDFTINELLETLKTTRADEVELRDFVSQHLIDKVKPHNDVHDISRQFALSLFRLPGKGRATELRRASRRTAYAVY